MSMRMPAIRKAKKFSSLKFTVNALEVG